MGLEALAAGLVVTVKDRTARGIASIGRGFKRLKAKGVQLRGAMSSLAPVAGQLLIVGAAVGVAFGVAAKKAIDFEKGLSAVRAVTSKAGQKDFPLLTAEIKRLGATTQFSATEAAAGAENLTRAGFTTTEVIAGLSGALNAAAADGIDMATAARLIANNVKAFGMEAAEANHVADVLANTSAKSNTNMTELGEALKFTAPIARELGISIENTSASLGVLADAGLQGSVGGTAFKNMLLKLAKPSEEGAKLMKKLGFAAVKDVKTGFVDVAATMDLFAEKMGKIPNRLEKVAAAQKIFGVRGAAAASNFVGVIEKTGKSLKHRFDEIQADTEGAAKRMADIRLDNVAGSFTLLGSALEGLAIEVFADNMGTTKDAVRFLADSLSIVVETLQQMKDGFIVESESMEKFRAKFGPLTDSLIAFGMGVRDGLAFIHQGIKLVGDFAQSVVDAFGSDSDMAQSIGMLLVIAAPVFLVLGAIAAAGLAIAIPLITMGAAIVAVLKVVGVALVGVVAGFALFAGVVNANKKEGQSFADAMKISFMTVKDFALDFAQGVKVGFETSILPAFESMKEAGAAMLDALDPIFQVIGQSFDGMGSDGKSMGETLLAVLGAVAQAFAWFVKNVLAPVIKFFANNFVAGFLSGMGDIFRGFEGLLSGSQSIGDSLIQIFVGAAKVIGNAFLVPIRGALDTAISAAEKFGLGDTEVITNAKAALEVLRFKAGPTAVGAIEGPKVINDFGKRKGAEAFAKPAVAGARVGAPKINITNKPGDTKTEIENKLCVDGREMAAASGRAEIENLERLGGIQTPFFNRAVRGSGGPGTPAGR